MGLVLELLAAGARDDREAADDVGECGHVAPEFFELDDWEDVFLAVAPAFFDILESDVGGHACGEITDGLSDLFLIFEVGADEAEDGEEFIEMDPCGHGVVEGETEFVFFAGHGEAFDETRAAVDAGEAAAAVFEPAGDDFEGETGL